MAAGRLRYRKADETRVGEDSDGTVAPFGQREIIDSVIQGIHPRIYGQLMKAAARMPQDLEDFWEEPYDNYPDTGGLRTGSLSGIWDMHAKERLL
ncbi:MAG: hypothetical protein ACYCTF_02965 [Acidiferrobacter sp.]